MDVIGTADPYFIARIDNTISFVCVAFHDYTSCPTKLYELGQLSKPTLRRQYGTSFGESRMFQQQLSYRWKF